MAMLVYWRVGNWFAIGGLWKANSSTNIQDWFINSLIKNGWWSFFRIQNRVGFCITLANGDGSVPSTRRSKKDAELIAERRLRGPRMACRWKVKQVNCWACLFTCVYICLLGKVDVSDVFQSLSLGCLGLARSSRARIRSHIYVLHLIRRSNSAVEPKHVTQSLFPPPR